MTRSTVSVLVVDDDEDTRAIVAELLEEEGYTVVTAANGADALVVLESVRPAVILLDLSMPIMDGQELRARLLDDPTLADIPTVVMTAADRTHDKTADLRIAATLSKPVSMQNLLDTVARYAR